MSKICEKICIINGCQFLTYLNHPHLNLLPHIQPDVQHTRQVCCCLFYSAFSALISCVVTNDKIDPCFPTPCVDFSKTLLIRIQITCHLRKV